LGHVLGAIANQFQSPLAEYWYHPEGNVAYVSMMSWLGQILNREEISKVFPTHPGLDGFRVPPELMGGESLQHRKQYLIYEDHRTNPFTQHLDWVANWMVSQGLFKEINVPMTLGNDTIGALIIRLPGDRQVTTQQIELAQALAHQATLAVKLTQLAQESRMATLLEERNRMAREIHDTLAQAFTGILMQLQAATGFLVNKPEQTSQCIIRAQDLAQSGLAQARQSVWYLHQDDLEADNLPQTLTRIAQQMTSGTSVQVEVYIQGTPYCLNAEVGMNLLRIAQESLTNALRHAEAQMIHLCLGYESDRIQLRVRDDGRGFDRQGQISGGFGLKGMQQRCDRIGAKLEINSQPGAGTEVNVVKALPN
jgi:signal transduction histidine kinase